VIVKRIVHIALRHEPHWQRNLSNGLQPTISHCTMAFWKFERVNAKDNVP